MKYEENILGNASTKDIETEKLHNEVNMLWNQLSLKLDSLSSYHFTPRPVVDDLNIKPSVSSIQMEEILYDLSIAYPQISFICLRYFNPIGVHHSGLLKENIMKASNVMPSILRVILGKENVFKIFGDDYDTHDGSALRDYVHVMDIAEGHLKALQVKHNVGGLHVYNLGNGKGYSVKELLKEMETVYGKKIPYTVEKRRPGDLAAVSADETKAQTELKWIPKYTLHDMCKSVIDAYC